MAELNAQQLHEWIETNVIPELSKTLGKPSDGARFDITIPQDTFFISCVCFLDLTFETDEKKNDENSEVKLRLVVKRPPLDDSLSAHMNSSAQFHNEILFYTRVARGNSRFPRCLLTIEGDWEHTVVVTENMSPRGYEICPDAYDVPVEYVFSAVNEIARFHAMAYVMKAQEPAKFKEVVNDIRESRFVKGRWLHDFIDIVTSRPVPWLRRNNCDPKFCDKIQRYFDNAFNEIMLPAIDPVEPLATLCHGDFTRNNIFFRRLDGKLEAMIIDFATVGYASPGIDLSTFLYLNCSSADRVAKFNDIFKSYHDTLIGYLRDAGVNDLEKYSYDNMLADYKRVAAFGYVITVFFLPVVRYREDIDLAVVRADHKAGARLAIELGGEFMDEMFGKMVLELRDMGCFDHL